jgi:DNA-binding MarR family transcriptional regulator
MGEQPPLLRDDEAATWRALSLVTQLVTDSLDHRLQRDAGLSRAYFDVLAALSAAPGRALRMSDLAHRLGFSQSRVTHAVASLERRRWVARQDSPGDRRGHLATLTARGQEALDAAAPLQASALRALLFEQLSPDETRELGALCHRLLDRFDCAGPHPRQPGGTLGRQ